MKQKSLNFAATLRRGRAISTILPFMVVCLFGQATNQIDSVRSKEQTFDLDMLTLIHGFKANRMVDPYEKIPFPSPFTIDSINTVRGIFTSELEDFEAWAEITGNWETISFYETVGGYFLKMPLTMTVEHYLKKRIYRDRLSNLYSSFAKAKSDESRTGGGRSWEVVGVETAAGRVSLNLRGNIRVMGKMVFQDQTLARSNLQESQTTHLEFDQQEHLNIEGKIGDRVSILMDQDSEREFDWENNIRVNYTGFENEIVQKIEAGNISLSLPSTNYVSFSGKSAGLFGLKSVLKFGPVDVTAIASIEQTKKEKKKFTGGSESEGATIPDYQYRTNQYFFLDKTFRDGGAFFSDSTGEAAFINSFYPLNESGAHVISADRVVIKEIDLFKSVGGNQGAGVFRGRAFADPNDFDYEPSEVEEAFFERLEWNVDYSVSDDLGYIRLRVPLQTNEILAVSYTLSRPEDDVVFKAVGELSSSVAEGDTIILKLLKPQTPNPGHSTWPLMFRNVYYLGTTEIEKEGFDLIITYKHGAYGNNEMDDNGNNYLKLFSLDQRDQNNNLIPDDLIDSENFNIINYATGELIFPMLHPFELDYTEPYLGEGNQSEELQNVLPDSALMYHSTNSMNIRSESKFEIQASYTNTSSTINLGGFMLVEGSEQVFLNNVQLQRGTDYYIDYMSGTVTFLTEAINAPDAELEIMYDKHELVSFDKKTIVGTRAQMDFGKNSFIGATALYFNQTVMNEKIEVGYEPTRNFIWDVNGRFETELDLLTRAIDKLPLIETNKPSSFKIEGEFAQVLPNPNPVNNEDTGDPNGVAFIDDFEGAKRTTSMPVRYRFWNRGSAPVDSLDNSLSERKRAKMFWYNPYNQVSTRDIWPNQETSIRAQNERTDVLVLDYTRRDRQIENDHPDSNWASITATLFSGDYNQSENKFFEIWMKSETASGKMTVDLGIISEDRNSNGEHDKEDQPLEGLSYGNTMLEDEEDIGLDLCEDAYENGYGGCLDSLTYIEALELELENLIYMDSDIDTDDPNGDNWSFSETASETRSKYRFINGTQGNGTAAHPLEPRYPDDEDLTGEGSLDYNNDYFTSSFDLSDTSEDWEIYQGGETSTGWRLYRIPLSEFDKIKPTGNITWDAIQFMRLTVSGVESDDQILIAKIELVGNEWQEMGVKSLDDHEYTANDSIFAVTTVNTEDNDDYEPPKGVQGEFDQLNQIRLKEQSLVLQFNDLGPKEEGAAKKNLTSLSGDRAQSYMAYKTMKLYTYGKGSAIWNDTTDVEFFIRFGHFDGLDEVFYEVRQPVYEEWDENEGRNTMAIDLDFMTNLKLQDSTSVELLDENDLFFITDSTRRYVSLSQDGTDTLRTYYIQGNPAINRLEYFIMGVKNRNSSQPVSGEVYVDELRLSNVRKDRGTAMRLQSTLTLADLGSATMTYTRTEADFHTLQEQFGSGRLSTRESFRFDSRISLNKLLPQAWGFNIPVNVGYTENMTTPKYSPGTDVLLNQENAPDSLLTKSRQMSLSTSFSKSTKSDNFFSKYTIDKLKGSFSGSHGWDSNEQKIGVNRNYNGNVSYNLGFGRDNYWTPLKFLKGIPWLGPKVEDTHLYYTPSSLDLSMGASETFSETTKRVGESVPASYNLGLNRTFKAGYKILENLKTNYSKTMKSDMDMYRARHLDAIKQMKSGIVTDVTESFGTNFTPAIFSWLKPSLNYSSSYRWSDPINSTREGANITSQARTSSSLTLSPKAIIETVYSPPKKSGSSSRRRGRRGGAQKDKKEEETKKPKSEGLQKILGILYDGASKINPISITYSESRSQNALGVIDSVWSGDSMKVVSGTASIPFRLGLTDELGLNSSSDVGVNTGSLSRQKDMTLRSGLSLTRKITTTFSYGNNQSWGVDGNNVETRSKTQDFVPLGDTGNEGLALPSWTLRWSGVENWPFIKWVAKSASLDHAFSGKQTQSWQNNELRSSKYTASFSPLVGISMTMVKGISLTTRYSNIKSIDNTLGGLNSTRVNLDKTWTASTNYSHKGGLKIPIFFFRDFNLENTINFTLTVDYSSSETRQREGTTGKLPITGWQKSWKLSPKITYSFTKRVTGGIWYEYRESEAQTVGRKIDRDFGFDVNIAIQG
ncbi:MAG: cell surface protein SprA [Candidatus Marinimicrobia bacterium]|nr:cell surface protein SprA [Candidatus Neomarinimicrobiota bacterium]